MNARIDAWDNGGLTALCTGINPALKESIGYDTRFIEMLLRHSKKAEAAKYQHLQDILIKHALLQIMRNASTWPGIQSLIVF